MRGPAIGPNMMPMPKMAIAIPCSRGGNVSSRIAWERGWSAPPPIPWRTRKKTSIPRLVADPHIRDATVNRRMEKRRYRFRPKVRARHRPAPRTGRGGAGEGGGGPPPPRGGGGRPPGWGGWWGGGGGGGGGAPGPQRHPPPGGGGAS